MYGIIGHCCILVGLRTKMWNPRNSPLGEAGLVMVYTPATGPPDKIFLGYAYFSRRATRGMRCLGYAHFSAGVRVWVGVQGYSE